MAKVETMMRELELLDGTEEWRVRFTWKGHDMDIVIRSEEDFDGDGHVGYFSSISEDLGPQRSDDWDGSGIYSPTPGDALNVAIAEIVITDWPDDDAQA